MDWTKQAVDGTTATQIAESVFGATYIGETGDSLRTIVVAGIDHAIVTWKNRHRVWQHWHRDPEARWHMSGETKSAAAAKTLAGKKSNELASMAEVRAMDAGTPLTVIAEWDPSEKLYNSNRPMQVRCSSPKTGEVIAGVFRRLGCIVTTRAEEPATV